MRLRALKLALWRVKCKCSILLSKIDQSLHLLSPTHQDEVYQVVIASSRLNTQPSSLGTSSAVQAEIRRASTYISRNNQSATTFSRYTPSFQPPPFFWFFWRQCSKQPGMSCLGWSRQIDVNGRSVLLTCAFKFTLISKRCSRKCPLMSYSHYFSS